MDKKREFGEGPLYTVMNYTLWFFVGNLYFGLCNIPLIYFILSIGFNKLNETFLIFILCLVPVGPAFTALLSVMGKVIRDKDVSITKDYFKAYKQSFKQSITIWILQLFIYLVLYVDIRFFNQQAYGKFLSPLMYAVIMLVSITGLYIYPIISRFYLKTKDVLKVSFMYSISKIKITLLNIGTLIMSILLIYYFPSISTLFIASVLCYFIMLYEKDILKELEEKIHIEQ